jgi:hypothetical protein
MRKVTLTAYQFDNFVYTPVANSSAENENELETALRVMRKLKDPKLTRDGEISPEEAKLIGKIAAYAPRVLATAEAIFEFEEDEFALILRRMNKARTSLALVALPDLMETIEVFNGTSSETEE